MSDWLVWQLADSAFPIGGFAHSGGLEAAWQHGEIRGRADLLQFAEASLGQLGHATLPFVTAAHREPARFAELDRLCDAFTSNHVANRASRLQGQALLASVERIFAIAELQRLRETEHQPPCGHFAPVFGVVMGVLGLDRPATARLLFFQHVRGLVAGAVRLGIIGPMEGQSLQHRLGPRAQAILERCEGLAVENLAQTAPLLDLWQGAQDRLYSRLFQS